MLIYQRVSCVSFAFICYKESITGVLGSQSLSGYQSSYNQISVRHNLIGKKTGNRQKIWYLLATCYSSHPSHEKRTSPTMVGPKSCSKGPNLSMRKSRISSDGSGFWWGDPKWENVEAMDQWWYLYTCLVWNPRLVWYHLVIFCD